MIINSKEKIKLLIDESDLLIFDFDGVLLDTSDLKTRAFAELYESYGEEVVDKILDHNAENGGLSRFDKIKFYHQNFLSKNIHNDEVVKIAGYFSKLVKDKVIASNEIPSSRSFLKSYCTGKKKCFVNSATPQNEIREIVKARSLDIFFLEVLGSPSSKDNNLKVLLDAESIKASKAIFFGDMESDFMAAEKVGVKFIGVGPKMLDILSSKEGVFYHINDFEQIIN